MKLTRLCAATLALLGAASLMGTSTAAEPAAQPANQPEVRFMTLDPGHFHAGLVHRSMYPGVSHIVDIYAPLDAELIDHLRRIIIFNTRADNPTDWHTEIHTGPNSSGRMIAERPGNAVILSGRNSHKIDTIEGSVAAGLHVLADKPWIIEAGNLDRLAATLREARENNVIVYDIMTERYEISSIVQRALANDPAVFGKQIEGTPEKPGVEMESIHHLYKTVAGAPLIRPTWFFDINEQGEALSDVGTHLVDLTLWTLSPEQLVDYKRDVEVLAARRWPTLMTLEQFSRVTGAKEFPAELSGAIRDGKLEYFCNTQVTYAVNGVHCKLDILWNYEAPHGDTHYAVYRGDRSAIEVIQKEEQKYIPEAYVVPNDPAQADAVLAAVRARLQAMSADYPGMTAEKDGARIRIVIPDALRIGHEAHFAEVTHKFLEYIGQPTALPEWETATMLAKYFITTRGVELSRQAN